MKYVSVYTEFEELKKSIPQRERKFFPLSTQRPQNLCENSAFSCSPRLIFPQSALRTQKKWNTGFLSSFGMTCYWEGWRKYKIFRFARNSIGVRISLRSFVQRTLRASLCLSACLPVGRVKFLLAVISISAKFQRSPRWISPAKGAKNAKSSSRPGVLAVKSLSAVNLSRKGRKKYPGPCKHSECRLFFTFKLWSK
mgnify:CR=1 FL=1